MFGALAAVGRSTLDLLAGVGRVFAFSFWSLRGMTRLPGILPTTVETTLRLTLRCALPVALVITPLGAMLALQALQMLHSFGVERQLAPLAASMIVRELAPGFAAVVVAMQGGAGIAAELAAMKKDDELAALDVMGLDSKSLVAGPRIVGAAIAAPLLNALAIATGIAGTYAMGVLVLGVPRALFLDSVLDGIAPGDLLVSELKAVVFGLTLGSVCAAAGTFAQPTAAGIGAAANRGVVTSVILILLFNYLLNTAIFGLQGGS